jgi:hypothetical protein
MKRFLRSISFSAVLWWPASEVPVTHYQVQVYQGSVLVASRQFTNNFAMVDELVPSITPTEYVFVIHGGTVHLTNTYTYPFVDEVITPDRPTGFHVE